MYPQIRIRLIKAPEQGNGVGEKQGFKKLRQIRRYKNTLSRRTKLQRYSEIFRFLMNYYKRIFIDQKNKCLNAMMN